jgi:competence protein ComGC
MKLNSPFTLHTQKIKPLFVFVIQLCTLFVVYIALILRIPGIIFVSDIIHKRAAAAVVQKR